MLSAFCSWPSLYISNNHLLVPPFDAYEMFRDLTLHGFQADGGGGGVGNIGGTAEKMVFLSIEYLPVSMSAREINAATKPAFAARVGSV